ncbi:exocyst complex component EXO70B1-like [Durio zibethinus]|uniref:Exocyst subunit Exo70 family protein n=1 Tax=Durio zibethinus TaxID=66656 RepID=A0A6P5XP53_DURZI|nr:exocyst complex component EXO70B1-like [Durio zibethinus]
MATTTTSLGAGGEDRVMATAQQIVKSLNTPKEVREDMLLILSTFDNRLSNITDLIKEDSDSTGVRFDAAEKVILRWDSSSSNPDASRHSLPWEDSPDEAAEYLSAVDEIIQLVDDMSVRSGNEIMDRAETAIQMAMSRLEDEFRLILISGTVPLDAEQLYGSIRRVSLSFVANEGEIDEEFVSFGEVDSKRGCFHERGASLGDDLCVDLINADAVIELKEIADRMIRSGYEKECVQAYCNVRRDALDECLVILGVEKLSIEEVQKIEWKALDEKMKKWIQAVKITVSVLLSGEKRLCDQIFNGSDSIKEICFNENAKGCVMQLLNFGEAVAIGKRSSEKLFRILDMYDVLADALLDFEMMVTDEYLCCEAKGVLAGLGAAAKGTFVEFENDVKNEASKKPMQTGEIHPLTRYVMNYVKLLVDYSETLNSLLESDEDEADGLQSEDSELENMTPFAKRLLVLISSLESNLEVKSKLYEDAALHCIFLMNNILYIVQKVKDSELGKLLGDNWVRRRRGQIHKYATSYLRACWTKALYCLKDEGISGSSNNASKLALKERFKNFNACFEEIYRIQTGWRVPDPQLREELRISISVKVLPAYRSFMGRFGSQLESGKHAGKYIKYTPEDLENYLLDLFEGSSLVLHHMRRKSS